MNTVVVVVVALIILGSGVTGYLFGNSTLGTSLYPSQLSIQNPTWVNSSGEHGTCGWGYTNAFGPQRPWVTCVVTIAAGGSGTISFNVSNSKGEVGFASADSSSNPLMGFFSAPQGCFPANDVGFCDIGRYSQERFSATFNATPDAYTSINATLTVELAVLSSSS